MKESNLFLFGFFLTTTIALIFLFDISIMRILDDYGLFQLTSDEKKMWRKTEVPAFRIIGVLLSIFAFFLYISYRVAMQDEHTFLRNQLRDMKDVGDEYAVAVIEEKLNERARP